MCALVTWILKEWWNVKLDAPWRRNRPWTSAVKHPTLFAGRGCLLQPPWPNAHVASWHWQGIHFISHCALSLHVAMILSWIVCMGEGLCLCANHACMVLALHSYGFGFRYFLHVVGVSSLVILSMQGWSMRSIAFILGARLTRNDPASANSNWKRSKWTRASDQFQICGHASKHACVHACRFVSYMVHQMLSPDSDACIHACVWPKASGLARRLREGVRYDVAMPMASSLCCQWTHAWWPCCQAEDNHAY